MSRDSRGDSVVDVTVGEAAARYERYAGWPELKESFIAGKVKAAYLLAPMAMDLVDKGVPAKIVALGHRSGAVIMVRADSTVRTMSDLRGRRIAIPSRFAVDHLFVLRQLKEHGMTVADVELVEMAPPEMPAALYANAVSAYATGEPFGAVAELAGYGRVLYLTRDKWPSYICCVLTVRQELIVNDRAAVQRLVNHILSAGAWLEASDANRDLAAQLGARRSVFNQDATVLKHVLSSPRDRVTYASLQPDRAEFDAVMRLTREAGIIQHEIPYEKYVDESFALAARPVDIHVQ